MIFKEYTLVVLKNAHINLNNWINKMKYEDSQHLIKNILDQVTQLQGQKPPSFGQNTKAPSLTSTGHNQNRYFYSHHQNTNPSNAYIKDYQSSNYSQRQSRDIHQMKQNVDEVLESEQRTNSQQKLRQQQMIALDQMHLRERDYQRAIRDLKYRLDEKSENEQYHLEGAKQLKQDNLRLSTENVRLKKEVLGQEFQMKMIENEMQALKQEDNSNRLREQIKIREEYHRKELRQKDEEREVQVDRIVRLFENYIQDLEVYYNGIIQDNQVVVSENIQQTLYSLKRTFNRNKMKEIDRIGMEYITTDIYETTKVRSKSKQQNVSPHQIEDNSTQVIKKVKQQILTLNRLKQKQIQEMRNLKDKFNYLNTETEYQKVYLGLIVELESLRYTRIVHKSSLEEQAEIIELKSEIKILNQELALVKRFSQGGGTGKQVKLQKELDIMKEYIREENESKIKFFTDLQKTKTSNQQIYSQNTRLRKEIQNLKANSEITVRNTRISNDYKVLELEYNDLKQQLQHKTTKIIQQQRQIRTLSQNNGVNQIQSLKDQLKIKQEEQLKLFSEMESLQGQISRLKTEKQEYLDVIRRIGANIQTEQELKTMLSKLQNQNVHLKSQNLMLRESMTQENITKATNQACRMITEKYDREVNALRAMIDRGKQEILTMQRVNGQLIQDLKVVNQQAKVKGVAVEHLWEVKNAEYENITAQLKRLQSL